MSRVAPVDQVPCNVRTAKEDLARRLPTSTTVSCEHAEHASATVCSLPIVGRLDDWQRARARVFAPCMSPGFERMDYVG